MIAAAHRYRALVCPRACPGGSRFVYESVTSHGYHITVWNVFHDGPPTTMGVVSGRGWTRAEARADGQRSVLAWLERQHKTSKEQTNDRRNSYAQSPVRPDAGAG